MSIDFHDVAAGLLAGIFSFFLIVYAFQPNRPYPKWLLEPADQPWVFMLIFVGIIYLVRWDYTIGVLALLCSIALVFDIIVFTQHPGSKEGLYTPAIDLLPPISRMFGEGFKNQNGAPKVLPKEEQVSKKWTVTNAPTPHELSRNSDVGATELNAQASVSGVPLSSPHLDEHARYPIFM